MISLEDYLAKLPEDEQERIKDRFEELKRQNIAFHMGMGIKVWPQDENFAPLYVRNLSDVAMVMREFPDHKMLYERSYY